MERTAVESSNITSAGYNDRSRVMEIEFQSGGIYQYDDVPADVWTGFWHSPSKGRFFYQHIKGKYQATKVN